MELSFVAAAMATLAGLRSGHVAMIAALFVIPDTSGRFQ